jgi:NAD(P)H dehydrogenase (quinone)
VTVTIILAHPSRESFNHAIVEHIRRCLEESNHQIYFHDLYAERFVPVLEIEELRRKIAFDDTITIHSRHIKESQGIIVVYPDWWGMPPAILKGWIDRVFRPGFAYDFEGEEFTEKEKVPLLTGKRAMVVTTTDETNPLSQEAMNTLWRERVFGYTGIGQVDFRCFYGTRESNGRERRRWMEELCKILERWALG